MTLFKVIKTMKNVYCVHRKHTKVCTFCQYTVQNHESITIIIVIYGLRFAFDTVCLLALPVARQRLVAEKTWRRARNCEINGNKSQIRAFTG